MATLELPYEKVYDLLHKCCTSISPDVLYLMKRAAAKETNPEAKTFLETMLKNVELAGQMDKPVCQSPGFPSVWIRWGEAMQPNLTNLMGNINQPDSMYLPNGLEISSTYPDKHLTLAAFCSTKALSART